MAISDATIKITNLRLRTYIGFNTEEREKQQDIVVNVVIRYPAEKASQTDDVSNALNYKHITKKIIQHVEEGHFLLLEKLVADVLEIATDHDWVSYAAVTIDKPHALRFADSVSLMLEYQK
jgi:D-erythro-7,8-dihydroneopterin triphosphate epimerase